MCKNYIRMVRARGVYVFSLKENSLTVTSCSLKK